MNSYLESEVSITKCRDLVLILIFLILDSEIRKNLLSAYFSIGILFHYKY